MDAPSVLAKLGPLVELAKGEHPTFQTAQEALAVLTDYTARAKHLVDGPKRTDFPEELARRLSHVLVIGIRTITDLSLPIGTEDAKEAGLACTEDRAVTAEQRVPPPPV